MKNQLQNSMRRLIACAALVGLCLLAVPPSPAQQRTSTNRGNASNSNRNSTNRSRSSSSSSAMSADDGGRAMGQAIIQYDPDTGSVIVIADDETNARIQDVVKNLDRPVPQVLIKVLFLEVTHTDDLDLGVEGTLNLDHGKDKNSVSTAFGLANEARGGFYKILDGDLEATVHAIAGKNKLEVLSRPSVLTRNNKEATITVGQEIPFITNSRVTTDGQTINTIQYSDIGIILRVTPHIAPERTVEMKVSPEISTLTADTVPISDTVNARVIAKRSAETRVVVGDGKTVVIGGMMENHNTDKVSKIPLLGDIPYVGALFRRTIKSKTKTELLIFLTPLVVENPEELHDASAGERANTTLACKAFSDEQMKEFLNDPRIKQVKPQAK